MASLRDILWCYSSPAHLTKLIMSAFYSDFKNRVRPLNLDLSSSVRYIRLPHAALSLLFGLFAKLRIVCHRVIRLQF